MKGDNGVEEVIFVMVDNVTGFWVVIEWGGEGMEWKSFVMVVTCMYHLVHVLIVCW